jgi:phage shock protein A
MKADSTQPIATPVSGIEHTGLEVLEANPWMAASIVRGIAEGRKDRHPTVAKALSIVLDEHAALTQQVADLQAENARLDAQVERLSVEIGRLNDVLSKALAGEKHEG